MIGPVKTEEFRSAVLDRSRDVAVIVDFQADWCGPCRQLGPMLERMVAEREGRVELATVDIESEEELAGRFHIQSIPAVVAIRDSEVVDAFVGTLPPGRIQRFIDRVDTDPPARGLRKIFSRN